jgi:hypothetical protein
MKTHRTEADLVVNDDPATNGPSGELRAPGSAFTLSEFERLFDENSPLLVANHMHSAPANTQR